MNWVRFLNFIGELPSENRVSIPTHQGKIFEYTPINKCFWNWKWAELPVIGRCSWSLWAMKYDLNAPWKEFSE
jgi:hypothetical protein